jgi:hypothetical protein
VHPTGHPDSRRGGSHLVGRRASTRFTQAGSPAFHSVSARLRWLAIAGIPSPGWPLGWLPTDQPESTHHPSSGRPVSQATPAPTYSPGRELDESTQGHPLSPPEPTPASRRRPEGQDPLTGAQPRAPRHEPRVPSTNESHLGRPGFRPSTSAGRHQYLGLAAKAWLPTCFHAPFQGALDPVDSGYSP